MNGYQVSATIHDYNNPGQKETQKIITKLDEIYNSPEYKINVRTKIYDNGLTRGVKINIFCWSLMEVHKQLGFLSSNITDLLEGCKTLPSVRINIVEKL